MNKQLKKIFTSIFILFLALQVHAQTPKDDLLFMLRSMQHLKAATVTAQQLHAGESELVPGNIAVILCGKVVKEIPENLELLKKAHKAGIQIFACGLSLNKFGIKSDELPEEVEYVENGFIKGFELQKAGYLSVEL